MAMKTKAAIKKANKKKIQRVPPAKIKQWNAEDLGKMKEIIMAAPDQVLGQKLAADHFGTTYASIQCRWSRYKRGTNMSRIKSKKKKKVSKITLNQSKTYKISPISEQRIPIHKGGDINRDILDIITIRSMVIDKDRRTIVIHY